MQIVKKFQLVLNGETVEIFDRLFEIAEEDDPEARYALAGDLIEFLLAEYDVQDTCTMILNACNIAKEELKELRYERVQNYIRVLIRDEVNNYISQSRDTKADYEFELLKEE